MEIRVPVTIFKEGKRFVAYTPVLDFATAGKTFQEAQHRFSEAVEIFIDEMRCQGTLDEYLESLGWKKKKQSWNPPFLVAQTEETVQMPALA